MTQIWSELLTPTDIAWESIGIDDNFFHLGGHSLKATIMISKIRNEMNADVPLVEVFKRPTIRQLAEYIEKTTDKTLVILDDNLIPLKKETSNTNHLFFVHDGTGEVEGYIEFCNHLDDQLNCWGIRADDLKNYTPQNLTIEEIAGKYIEKIKKLQPHGPYSIAGWSLGGTIAFEMVKQLEKNGEKTAFLALFDSPCLRRPGGSFEKPPPGPLQNFLLEFTLRGELQYIREYVSDKEMIRNLEKVTGIDDLWPTVVDYLEENDTATESIKKIIREHGLPYFNFEQASIKELIHSLNVTRTLLKARDKYIPSGKIQTTVHYFEALESKEIIKQNWDEYCEAGVKYYTIPGDHFSIFKKPQVEKFAQIFQESLKDSVFQQ